MGEDFRPVEMDEEGFGGRVVFYPYGLVAILKEMLEDCEFRLLVRLAFSFVGTFTSVYRLTWSWSFPQVWSSTLKLRRALRPSTPISRYV